MSIKIDYWNKQIENILKAFGLNICTFWYKKHLNWESYLFGIFFFAKLTSCLSICKKSSFFACGQWRKVNVTVKIFKFIYHTLWLWRGLLVLFKKRLKILRKYFKHDSFQGDTYGLVLETHFAKEHQAWLLNELRKFICDTKDKPKNVAGRCYV